MTESNRETLEGLIEEWRTHLLRCGVADATDLDELERSLRDQAAEFQAGGLADDEAFLIAVRRTGETDATTRAFARERLEQLWERSESVSGGVRHEPQSKPNEFIVVVGLAVAAGLAIKAPEALGFRLNGDEGLYVRNLSLFVLPMLAGYFAWKRGLSRSTSLWLVLLFLAAAVFANVYPFYSDSHTELLTALHLPFALWLVVGVAYVGGRWRSVERRTDFVRFSGELFIYYVLIALGGGVFSLITWGMFEVIDVEVGDLIAEWLLPCGAMGAVLVGAWLVESRRGVVKNIAPMLSRVFTPLFAVMLSIFLVAMLVTGEWSDLDRDILIAFDVMLALVLGLLLFSVSASDSTERPGLFNALQFLLVVAAILADVIALEAITGRISDFGFSPNRTAALGGNLVLLGNLVWSAWLYGRFLRGRGPFSALVRWQVNYLPVYAVWAVVVVVVFPLLFGFA